MKPKYIITVVALYVMAGIAAFGHSATARERWHDSNCATVQQRINDSGIDCFVEPIGPALGAAIFWPLYLSWELWS